MGYKTMQLDKLGLRNVNVTNVQKREYKKERNRKLRYMDIYNEQPMYNKYNGYAT